MFSTRFCKDAEQQDERREWGSQRDKEGVHSLFARVLRLQWEQQELSDGDRDVQESAGQ